MSLNHVILGLLNREPLTGYEIKKIIQNTPFMYWSGNNNQIYKAFVELSGEGFVTKKVLHQDGSPSKHIYSITDEGRTELNSWLLSATDEPAFRKQFLIKLALADGLKRGGLEKLLTSYANIVKMQAVLSERELDKCYFAGQDPQGKSLFIDLIRQNILSFYSSELAWTEKVKELIEGLPEDKRVEAERAAEKESNRMETTMNYKILEKEAQRYLHITGGGSLIQRERDALDIISICAEQDTNAVILDGVVLSEDFMELKTGLAGSVLQKFAQYNIKAAVIMEGEQSFPVRFREMVSEQSTGGTFRIFNNLEDAAVWLLA